MADNFWFKFNFKDWANDVKPLSLNARGLLLELIIYLRQCDPIGEIPVDVRLMIRLTGGLTDEVTSGLNEFRLNKIFDFEIRDGKEFLISRRIKKEKAKSIIAVENGSKGGNPKLLDKQQIRLTKKVNQKNNLTPNSNSNSIFNFNFIINSKVENEKLKNKLIEFCEFRKKLKKPYKTEDGLKKLIEESGKYDVETYCLMVDQSIKNEWQGIFELKESRKKEVPGGGGFVRKVGAIENAFINQKYMEEKYGNGNS